MKKILALLILSLAVPSGIAALAAAARAAVEEQPRSVRVGVVVDAPRLVLSVRGRFEVRDAKRGDLLFADQNLPETTVTTDGKAIFLGNEMLPGRKIRILPQKDAAITINKRRFRGNMQLIGGNKGLLTAVNEIELEDYVKGVLYHEISHRWPLEAIKAQAVATRTYAVFRMESSKRADYDMTSDIYSQVYGGKTSEKYRTTMAVNRTKGLVLVYGSQILPAYFHATCGGHTEDASELWEHDMLPLKGVPCIYCQKSPHYSWKKNFRSKDVQDKLNASGYHLGLIKDIEVVERNVSGRIRKLAITTRDGKVAHISGKDFRNIIGPNEVRSNNYEVQMQGYYFDLVGKGWGHGVGLCQWGAYELARQHKTFEHILQYYYPGADVVDLRDAE